MNKLFALVLLVSSISFANTEGRSSVDYSMAGVEGGFKWASAEVSGANSNKQVIGYQIGGTMVFDIMSNIGVKTGLLYNERPFESSSPAGTFKGKITYFDIPAFLMFKFEDYAGIYLGPSVSFKLGDEANPASLTGIKGTLFPITVGGQFKFAPNMGVNIYFETVGGQIADNLLGARAIGANLMFTFD